jgi:hypothetical protein
MTPLPSLILLKRGYPAFDTYHEATTLAMDHATIPEDVIFKMIMLFVGYQSFEWAFCL